MCGIAGVVRSRPLNELDHELTKGQGGLIRARGPDATTFWAGEHSNLIFHRLSIIDIDGGAQPFESSSGDVVCAVNGEIFNFESLRSKLEAKHQFKTKSDCEVVLHLYKERGIEFLNELRGMFAIVLIDLRERRAVLAVDQFAVKPLFYSIIQSGICFGSEVKSILAHPEVGKSIDWSQVLNHSWMTGSTGSSQVASGSFFEGVQRIEAGSCIVYDWSIEKLSVHRYWNIEDCFNQLCLSRSDLVKGYQEHLQDSISLATMSDAQVGVFLSGGIDSGIITAQATQKMSLECFTASNKATLANGDVERASLLAKHLGVAHHILECDMPSSIDEWSQLVWICETPFCGPDQWFKWRLHGQAKSLVPNLKVILSGQGSDEFNGGYSSQFSTNGWEGFLDYLSFSEIASGFSEPLAHKFLKNEVHIINKIENCNFSYKDYVRRKFVDLQMYNLWTEDRVSSSCGIETRVPFCDFFVVKASLGISEHLHADLLWDKCILREASMGILPDWHIRSPKVPFYFGSGEEWVWKGIRSLLLGDGASIIEEVFSRDSVLTHAVDRDRFKSWLDSLRITDGQEWLVALRWINLGILEKEARRYLWKESFQNLNSAI